MITISCLIGMAGARRTVTPLLEQGHFLLFFSHKTIGVFFYTPPPLCVSCRRRERSAEETSEKGWNVVQHHLLPKIFISTHTHKQAAAVQGRVALSLRRTNGPRLPSLPPFLPTSIIQNHNNYILD